MDHASDPLILVTGATGKVGRAFISRLLAEPARSAWRVRAFCHQRALPPQPRVESVFGAIQDRAAVQRALEGVTHVLHQAALPSVQRSIMNPLTTTEVNVNGTLNILEAARFHKVQRIVYASSSSIYGDTPTLPKDESMRPQPLSPYAITKLAGEEVQINLAISLHAATDEGVAQIVDARSGMATASGPGKLVA